MQQQFKVFGLIVLVLGIIGVTGALAVIMFISLLAYNLGGEFAELDINLPLTVLIMVLASLNSILYIIAGLGLIKRKPWARTVTIISSILSLPGVPFWTALGVYGLWLMFSADGVRGWEAYIRGDVSPAV